MKMTKVQAIPSNIGYAGMYMKRPEGNFRLAIVISRFAWEQDGEFVSLIEEGLAENDAEIKVILQEECKFEETVGESESENKV